MAGTRDGLPVSFAGKRYEVDVETITWSTVPPTRQGSDQGAGPGEQSLTLDNVWRRSRDDWRLGAGQEFTDLIEESEPRRFRSSDAIDPWTVRSIKPLPTVEQKRSSVNTNLRVLSVNVGGTDYLVIVDGADVRYSSNPTNASPTFTAHTSTGASSKTGITTDGYRWWACDGSDIYMGTPGTAAASTFSTYNADVVGYANGRLLAADGAELVEVASDGTTTTIMTHPNSAFVWTDVVSSPGGIYAFGNVGDRSEVYVITAIDTTGALDVPFVAMELPQGEYLRAMCSYAGVMVLATSKGIRLALITGGGFLSYGPVIDDPGDVRCLEPQGEDVWFGWTDTSTTNGLGRVRLSRFVEELVPAFASDLRINGTVAGAILSVCTVGSRRYFAASGAGFYGETTTYEATSTIDLGWFTFGISEEKLLDSITVWCDALPASCSIVANVYPDDSSSSMLTLTLNTAAQTKETAAYSSTTKAERLRVVLTLTQSGSTPVVVKRVTLRAAPTPFVSQMIVLPLYLSDEVVASTGQQVGQDPYAEFLVLEALVKARTRGTLTVGTWSGDARIESVSVEKGGLGGGNGLDGWADNRKFMAGKWDVAFMTLEPSG